MQKKLGGITFLLLLVIPMVYSSNTLIYFTGQINNTDTQDLTASVSFNSTCGTPFYNATHTGKTNRISGTNDIFYALPIYLNVTRNQDLYRIIVNGTNIAVSACTKFRTGQGLINLDFFNTSEFNDTYDDRWLDGGNDGNDFLDSANICYVNQTTTGNINLIGSLNSTDWSNGTFTESQIKDYKFNISWNQSYADTVYSGSDNATWNETYADGLYTPIGAAGMDYTSLLLTNNSLYNATISALDTNTQNNTAESAASLCSVGQVLLGNGTCYDINLIPDGVGTDNVTWNETYADTLYAAIGVAGMDYTSILLTNNSLYNATILALDTNTQNNTGESAASLCVGVGVFLDGEGNCRNVINVTDTNTQNNTGESAATLCVGADVYLDGNGDCRSNSNISDGNDFLKQEDVLLDNRTATPSANTTHDFGTNVLRWATGYFLNLVTTSLYFTSLDISDVINTTHIVDGTIKEADFSFDINSSMDQRDTDTQNDTGESAASLCVGEDVFLSGLGNCRSVSNISDGNDFLDSADVAFRNRTKDNVFVSNMSVAGYINATDWSNVTILEAQVTDADWWDADGDVGADEISESKINFGTACAAGNHYYLNGNDLACESDADTQNDTGESAATLCVGADVYLDGNGNCRTNSNVSDGNDFLDISNICLLNATKDNILVSNLTVAGYINATDWSNVTIGEGQIRDLSHTADTDTNASTACADGEALLGNGTCYDINLIPIADTDTSASVDCADGEVLLGNGTCWAFDPVIDTDANTQNNTGESAANLCVGASVFLDGNGNCINVINVTDTNTQNNTGESAASLCVGVDVFLDGNGDCRSVSNSSGGMDYTSLLLTNNSLYNLTIQALDTHNNTMNITILEAQITDLSHTTDTVNNTMNITVLEAQITDLTHTSADNASWSESYADGLYTPIGTGGMDYTSLLLTNNSLYNATISALDTNTQNNTGESAANLCVGASVFLDGAGSCINVINVTDTNTQNNTGESAASLCVGTDVYLDGNGDCRSHINVTDTDTNDFLDSADVVFTNQTNNLSVYSIVAKWLNLTSGVIAYDWSNVSISESQISGGISGLDSYDTTSILLTNNSLYNATILALDTNTQNNTGESAANLCSNGEALLGNATCYDINLIGDGTGSDELYTPANIAFINETQTFAENQNISANLTISTDAANACTWSHNGTCLNLWCDGTLSVSFACS